MGLFDGISKLLGGDSSGVDTGAVAGQFMGVLQQHGIGDLSGLVSQFEQSGLGAHVASWVGDGQNLPISADQIQSALGSPVVESVAAKFGVDPATASQLLSQHLPAIMSHLSQNGPVPDAASP